MNQFCAFPSIEQYRNAIRNVKQHVSYAGKDENGDPVYAHSIAPKLNYVGTVKLHGTNSAVVQKGDSIWCQSRNNIITPEKDNAGFARFITEEIGFDAFKPLFEYHRQLAGIGPNSTIAIYGEWCGKGIQKKVAIAELPKMFVIFAVKVFDDSNNGDRETCQQYWLRKEEISKMFLVGANVFNIYQFPHFDMEIDFENPHIAQQKLGELTMAVEKECPVGKYFGISGTGEGIVWSCIDENFRSSKFTFKVKGEEHQSSKVTTLASVDVERVNGIKELVSNLVTDQRLQQGIDYLTEQHLEIDPKNMGPFLKWVANDVFKEEMDTITENGFEQKDLGKEISNKARIWFLTYINNN